MRSDSLDYIGTACPKLAHLTNIGINTFYPYNILKTAMDELVTKKGMTVRDTMKKLEPYLYKTKKEYLLSGFEKMADFMKRMSRSIISIDAEVPFSIGRYPLTVYVPYILNYRKRDIIYVWPDWETELNSLQGILRHPSIMACYLSAKREQEIDTSIYYGTLILNEFMTMKMKRPAGLHKLFEDQLESIVEGALNEKERIKAGPYCSQCPTSKTCLLKPERVNAITQGSLFTISESNNGRLVAPDESRIRD